MSVTIKDIAEAAGCAFSTVSRVLNNRPDVSKETRSRVLKAIDELNFVPNNVARTLKRTASRNIAIIVKGNSNLLFQPMIEQLQDQIRDNHYTDFVHYIDEKANAVTFALQVAKEFKPLGLIFLGGELNLFQEKFSIINIPSVLLTVSAKSLKFPNLSSVGVDDTTAAEQAIVYLLDRGHRKIGVIGGSVDKIEVNPRYEGMLKAFREHNIPFDPEVSYRPSRYSLDSAHRNTIRLIQNMPGITAIFAMSDVMAFGAMSAISDQNLKVPDDISVIGFDGVELGSYYIPKLTTVCQPLDKIVKRGVEIVIDGIENEAPAVHEFVPFTMMRGKSVKRLTI